MTLTVIIPFNVADNYDTLLIFQFMALDSPKRRQATLSTAQLSNINHIEDVYMRTFSTVA